MASKKKRANLPALSQLQVEQAVRAALLEDLGLAGDVTSDATIPANAKAVAQLNSREEGIIAGLGLFGVAVGTYSSVFIAAPILLADKRKVVITSGVMVAFLMVSGIAATVMGI